VNPLFEKCHNERLCRTCGEKLGVHIAFLLPNAAATINRISSDLPCHLRCATRMAEADTLGKDVRAIWTARTSSFKPRGYILFRDPTGKPLIEIGDPEAVTWWREGRPATRAEIMHSIDTGMPLLRAACDKEQLAHQQDEAHAMLNGAYLKALEFVPAEQSKIIITG
jgi:hypothetical protein